MADDLHKLVDRLRGARFPMLGKSVGDFVLYDALLAGYAQRVNGGETVAISDIPTPDEETANFAHALRCKGSADKHEREFLEYFDLLEQIRAALH